MYNQAKINGFTCLIATITHNLRRYHLTLLTVYYLALAKNQCKVFIHASRKLIQTYFPFIAICNNVILLGRTSLEEERSHLESIYFNIHLL